jgi:hypothetical protein
MSAMLHPALSGADLLGMFAHFLVLSLLAIGGAITTAPDMHRYVVDEHHWISDAQFSASIAIAQAAPGPNVLFVAVIGWNVAGPDRRAGDDGRDAAALDRADADRDALGPASARHALRARLQDRPHAADHRPARRDRLAAGAARTSTSARKESARSR